MSAKRILLLASSARDLDPYVAACEKLSLSAVAGVPTGARLPPLLRDSALDLDFTTRDSVLKIVTETQADPVAAIIAIDEEPTTIAARAASMMGLSCHPPKAADACLDQAELQRILRCEGVPVSTSQHSQVLAVLVSDRKLRVCLSCVSSLAQAVSTPPAPVTDTLVRAFRALGLQHGPAHVEVAPERDDWAIVGISLASAHPFTELVRFKIPLVDEDVSWPEAVIRNALGLDISRLHAR
jgi:Lon protease-like protein